MTGRNIALRTKYRLVKGNLFDRIIILHRNNLELADNRRDTFIRGVLLQDKK